jgi:hypothetical protein
MLTFRNRLADAYESAGDLGRAIPLFERILADAERALGVDHPDTLTYRTTSLTRGWLSGIPNTTKKDRRDCRLNRGTGWSEIRKE